jgi:hypothetical protein
VDADLCDDKFHFQLPVWINVDRAYVRVGPDGRMRIQLPGKLESACTPEGKFVSLYTDQHLAERSRDDLQPSVVSAMIVGHDEFKRLLQYVLEAGVRYIGVDPGYQKVALIEIEPLLREMD